MPAYNNNECDVHNLAAFLRTTVNVAPSQCGQALTLHSENGDTLSGLATITRYLVKRCGDKSLSGLNVEEEACISQWMQYRLTHVDPCTNIHDLQPFITVLNAYLSDKTYMVAERLTVADIFLYYSVRRAYEDMTFDDKEKFMNLSRWLDHVQHECGLRQEIPQIVIQRNLLYTSVLRPH